MDLGIFSHNSTPQICVFRYYAIVIIPPPLYDCVMRLKPFIDCRNDLFISKSRSAEQNRTPY